MRGERWMLWTGGWRICRVLLAESDFVTRHALLTEATRNLMGARDWRL